MIGRGSVTNFWKSVWDKKGLGDSTDLLYLDGYEHLDIPFKSPDIFKSLSSLMGLKKGDSILEVGCGCGFLAREFKEYNYAGVDYSEPIIAKHRKMFSNHAVSVSEAKVLSFPDSSFDKVFCFGLFQYLPSLSYAEEVIEEMKRVSKEIVFLGDLKDTATRSEHLVYPKERLSEGGFSFSNCVYDAGDLHRYNALFKV